MNPPIYAVLYRMFWIVFILSVSIIVQLYHWYFIFPMHTRPKKETETKQPSEVPFSVVVCFHREWTDIPEILKILSDQNYAHFEIVLVNDGPVILQADHKKWLDSHSKIRLIEHQKKAPGKKKALIAGINAARFDWLVFTDIDCFPSKNWLSALAKYIPEKPSILLGYGPYVREEGLLNFTVVQETILTALQYLGWAEKGYSYMGVGRNLVYHISIYEIVTFQSHLDVSSGDDDLFVNEAGRRFPVEIITDADTFVYSRAPKNWPSWRQQKIRHLSTGKFYSRESKVRISLFNFSLGIEKAGIILLAILGSFKIFIPIIILKAVLTIFPIRQAYGLLDQKQNFWKMWIYEWIHIGYLSLNAPWIFFKTKKKWD